MRTIPISPPRTLINPPGRVFGTLNAIVSGRLTPQPTDQHIVSDFEGPLSIKFMVHGTGQWDTPTGRCRIEDRRYVILNEGQRCFR